MNRNPVVQSAYGARYPWKDVLTKEARALAQQRQAAGVQHAGVGGMSRALHRKLHRAVPELMEILADGQWHRVKVAIEIAHRYGVPNHLTLCDHAAVAMSDSALWICSVQDCTPDYAPDESMEADG